MQTIVVIPTYNERDNIKRLIEEVLALSPDIGVLIVDDASPDGTGKIVERLTRESDRVMILHRSKKQGLGSAYRDGFQLALQKKPAYIMEMDADFSHSPEDIPLLLEKMKEADLAIGSRYIPGGRLVNWPLERRLLSQLGNIYINFFLHLPVKDTTSGFRIYKRKVLEAIDLEQLSSNGFAFQIEMLYRAFSRRFKIKEVPITFVNREIGTSKMSFKIIWEALFLPLRLKRQRAKK